MIKPAASLLGVLLLKLGVLAVKVGASPSRHWGARLRRLAIKAAMIVAAVALIGVVGHALDPHPKAADHAAQQQLCTWAGELDACP